MNATDAAWESRLTDLWKTLDERSDAEFVEAMGQLTARLPEGSAVGLFELGAAHDSTGSPQHAVSLYPSALRAGLSGLRRRRAHIQMASSLRNLGQPQQAAEILFEELRQPSDALDQAVAAFLALALADLGREREALFISLGALSQCLPRYNRSLARYAQALNSASWRLPSRVVTLRRGARRWVPGLRPNLCAIAFMKCPNILGDVIRDRSS